MGYLQKSSSMQMKKLMRANTAVVRSFSTSNCPLVPVSEESVSKSGKIRQWLRMIGDGLTSIIGRISGGTAKRTSAARLTLRPISHKHSLPAGLKADYICGAGKTQGQFLKTNTSSMQFSRSYGSGFDSQSGDDGGAGNKKPPPPPCSAQASGQRPCRRRPKNPKCPEQAKQLAPRPPPVKCPKIKIPPPKICFRKCPPPPKLPRLPKLPKIPAPPKPPPLPRLPKLPKCPVPLAPPPPPAPPKLPKLPKCPECPPQMECPQPPPCEPCPCPPPCPPPCCPPPPPCPPCPAPIPCPTPLPCPPPPPPRVCPPCPPCPACPACPAPKPCPPPEPCCPCPCPPPPPPCPCPEFEEVQAKCPDDAASCSLAPDKKGKKSGKAKPPPSNREMSTYHRPSSYLRSLRRARSRGFHTSAHLLGKKKKKKTSTPCDTGCKRQSKSKPSAPSCQKISDVCASKDGKKCTKSCPGKGGDCYAKKGKCDDRKVQKREERKCARDDCPKTCIPRGKCDHPNVAPPPKLEYKKPVCPPPKLVSPRPCPDHEAKDSDVGEEQQPVKTKKKEVCPPPPMPKPPCKPIVLCPCPPPPKLHPGACPCYDFKEESKVTPTPPCPLVDKYPCQRDPIYCPPKSKVCERKSACDKSGKKKDQDPKK